MKEDKEFKCDSCGEIFEKGWSDKECESEMKRIWGDIPIEERAIICDDCFNSRTKKEILKMGREYKKLLTP